MIEISAVIEEGDIVRLGELKGHANSTPVTICPETYDVGTLRFMGFAGGLSLDTMKYHGVYRFEKTTFDGVQTRFSFSVLPGWSE